MATRNGSAIWRGDLKSGTGEVTVGNGVFSGNFSYTSRFEGEGGTNPEELIAAAHASCYSMQLSAMLANAGFPATSVDTSAVCTLRIVDNAPTITQIALTTVGVVPGISAEQFSETAAAAKESCLISRALAGVGEITLDATLQD